jgi:hypothetical protein
MKIEPMGDVVLEPVIEWARAQADREGIRVERVIARALARERAVVEGRKVDPRTVMVGAGPGAHTRVMPLGTVDTDEIAARAAIPKEQVLEFVHRGWLHSVEPPTRGRRTAFDPGEAFYALLVDTLARAIYLPADAMEAILAAARGCDRCKGVTVTWHAGTGRAEVLGDGHLGERVRATTGAAVCVSLEHVDRALRDIAEKRWGEKDTL